MFSFELKSGEEPILILRQTEAVLIIPVLIIIAAIYIPSYFLSSYGLLNQFGWYLLVWIIIMICYGLYNYLLWLVNSTVVTNERIGTIQYRTFFHKEVAEITLPDVKTIRYKTSGLVAILFDYGDVILGGSDGGATVVIEKVRHPKSIKEKIITIKSHTVDERVYNNFQ